MTLWWGRYLVSLAVLAGASGCTIVKAGNGGVSRTLIGIVRVELPPTTGQVTAIDVRTVGLGWDEGPFAGYRGSNWIVAPSGQCQLTVVIRSAAEAAQAAHVLEQLKGDNLCTANFAAPSR